MGTASSKTAKQDTSQEKIDELQEVTARLRGLLQKERSAKAVFAVTIGCVDCEDLTVLGNMPESTADNESASAAWSLATQGASAAYAEGLPPGAVARTIKFDDTARMSTYLLALTIGQVPARVGT